MRAPLYASSEFPNANPDLHAGRIDPMLWATAPEVEDDFGDGDVLVVEELPELATTEAEIEVVGSEPESPRDSMIRLVSAVGTHGEEDDESALASFSSLAMPTLPPLDPALLASMEEADVDREPMFVSEPALEQEPARKTLLEFASAPIEPAIEAPVESAKQDEDEAEGGAEAAEAPRANMDMFARLVEAICDVASEAGVTVSALGMIELLSGRPVPPVLLGAASGTLVAAAIAESLDGSLVLSAQVKPAAIEWARIVRDEGGDLEVCGGKTLDEFAAGLACGIVGDRAKYDTLRRALRSRGIAAYGLVCDAA